MYGSHHRIMAAKFMFLSYQKASCKLYFSRTRSFKKQSGVRFSKKNLVINIQLGFLVELTPINSYFGMGGPNPQLRQKVGILPLLKNILPVTWDTLHIAQI